MPEIAFSLRWPDGTTMACRSPSTILRRHLPAASYELDEFLVRAQAGLVAASDRVRAVHGFPCAQAARQWREIEAAAEPFRGLPRARVTVDPC